MENPKVSVTFKMMKKELLKMKVAENHTNPFEKIAKPFM